MQKNIQTHNAKIDLVKKFLDYANCADASYAMLHFVDDTIEYEDKNKQDEKGDGQKLGSTYFNKDTNTEQISTYARAIEARFMQDSKNSQGKKIDNHNDTGKLIKMYPKDLTDRTIKFTNRFKLLKHQENTSSGFSATLFKDTQADSKDSEYILAFRGTDFPSGFSDDVLDADADLANSKLPSNQYIDMIKFYTQCIVDKHITESTPLIIIGHSLGGALAQLLTLSLATAGSANNVKEVYTFNSPGAKNLKPHIVLDSKHIYEVDESIIRDFNDFIVNERVA